MQDVNRVDPDTGLDREMRRELLAIARNTIRHYLLEGREWEPAVNNPSLREARGAFVSIHIGGRLRGCIGTFEADSPLCLTIRDMAISASTRDPRFPAMEPHEMERMDLEISVLSPLRTVRPGEVEVGKHGIYITKGYRRGVLLPQVAVNNGWDRETFLSQTCWKARLPQDAWKDPDTEVQVFTADVFGEDSFQGEEP